MTVEKIFETAAAIIFSLGGGGAIVFALSSWLGKIWANRLMEKDRAKYEKELNKIKNDLDIYKEKHLKGYADKIVIYRLAVDIVSEILGDLDYIQITNSPHPNGLQRFDKFNRNRMKAYGYLAMLAPQNVMDAFDALFDNLIQLSQGQKAYKWEQVRELAISLLNAVRKDIGVDESPIEYHGKL